MKIETKTRVRHGQDGKRYDLRTGMHNVPDAVGEYLVRRGHAVAIVEEQPAAPEAPKAPAAVVLAETEVATAAEDDQAQGGDADEASAEEEEAAPAADAPAGKQRRGKAKAQG